MVKLLVNSPTGEQQLIMIDVGGEYFDMSLVEWDERTDGILPPDITLGKMVRNGEALDVLPDYLPDHAAYAEIKQAAADIDAKKIDLDSETKKDGDLAALRLMNGDEVDIWFDQNIVDADQHMILFKKVVKSLIKQNLL